MTVPPVIEADAPIFVGSADVRITTARKNVELRYTIDGREPEATSPLVTGPVRLTQTATVRARAFRGDRAVSGVTEATFTSVTPKPAVAMSDLVPGLAYVAVAGDYSKLPDFGAATGASTGAVTWFDLKPRPRETQFAMKFDGYVSVPAAGVYTFYLRSDDGSRMWVDGALLIDNDGLHSSLEKRGAVALEKGLHPIAVAMFEQSGGFELDVAWSGPGLAKQRVPEAALVPAEVRDTLDRHAMTAFSRILLTGGGTAGHVNPALAIGRALGDERTAYLYVGVRGRAESRRRASRGDARSPSCGRRRIPGRGRRRPGSRSCSTPSWARRRPRGSSAGSGRRSSSAPAGSRRRRPCSPRPCCGARACAAPGCSCTSRMPRRAS